MNLYSQFSTLPQYFSSVNKFGIMYMYLLSSLTQSLVMIISNIIYRSNDKLNLKKIMRKMYYLYSISIDCILFKK